MIGYFLNASLRHKVSPPHRPPAGTGENALDQRLVLIEPRIELFVDLFYDCVVLLASLLQM
jgi:hypothetical protein